MSPKIEAQVRSAQSMDHAFVLSLFPRFVEFPLPAWCETHRTSAVNREHIEKGLATPVKGEEFLVAEDAHGVRLGFIHLQTERDFFGGEEIGYIADRAVCRATEEWSRRKKHRLLALSTFSNNQRAVRFYEKSGYQEEIRKYVKVL